MSNFIRSVTTCRLTCPPMGRQVRAHLHRARCHAHSWNAPARREHILLKFFSRSEFESRKQKKAGQNFYRSDLLKLLVAGTGFEPMTFGLQEQRRPPCFFLFSAFLGIPGLSSARVIRYSLPIFSPIPCWGDHFFSLYSHGEDASIDPTFL